jgi:hypothetical protein
MAARPGRRRLDHSSPLVDLDAVFADDALIDEIAARPWEPAARNRFAAGRGAGPVVTPSSPDPLTDIFRTWRQELAERPLPSPPPLPARQTSAVVAPSWVRPRRSRVLRPALSVAAAIAALLIGSTTVGSKDAVPGSPLWGIAQVLWPDRAESVASRFEVRDALLEARTALDAGNERDAELALLRATAELGNVDDIDGRGAMEQQVAALWVEANPDPNAAGTTTTDAPPVGRASTSAGSAAVLPSTTSSSPLPVGQLAAALPADADRSSAAAQVETGSPAIVAARPAPVYPPPLPTIEASNGVVSSAAPTLPTIDSPGSVASSADASTVPSAPSTVPPPSVPIAPTTPPPATNDSTSQSAPALSAPMPTPSSPGSSGEAEAPDPVTAPPASSSTVIDSRSAASALAGISSAP